MSTEKLEKLRVSRSTESPEAEPIFLEQTESLRQDLEEEVKRIISEEQMIGEGRAAKVFELKAEHSHLPACVKIWFPKINQLAKINIVEYRKIQYLSPEEEFVLQDELFLNGFRDLPRPIAYGRLSDHQIFVMEKISGYNLQQIITAGAKIAKPGWGELERMLRVFNINHKIVHRDLHPGNIMLGTENPLERGARLEGKLYLIDFGLSKRIQARPSDDDFKLTIGRGTVIYKDDRRMADALRPTVGSSPFIYHS